MALMVETTAANNITATKATLNGYLTDDNGDSPVSCYFEYGADETYGNETEHQEVVNGAYFYATIDILETGTYHFRAVAIGTSLDIAYGEDLTFTTSAETVSIYKSIDSMQTWKIVKTITGSTTGIVEIDGSDIDSNKVAFGEDRNIWVTVDGGNNWRIAYTHPQSDAHITGLMVRNDEIQASFIGVHHDGYLDMRATPGVVRSPNFGNTWYDGDNINGSTDIAFDRSDPLANTMTGINSQLLKSVSSEGNNPYYQEVETVNGDIVVLEADREMPLALIGTTEGLYKTVDWGESVVPLLSGMEVVDVAIGGSFLQTIGLVTIVRPSTDYSVELEASLNGSHYAQIDDSTLNTVDYVFTEAGPLSDVYNKATLPLTSVSSIASIKVKYVYEAVNGYVEAGIVVNGVDYMGSQNTSTEWAEGEEVWTTNPATSSYWTLQDIAELKLKITLQASTGVTKVAQLWLEVAYNI